MSATSASLNGFTFIGDITDTSERATGLVTLECAFIKSSFDIDPMVALLSNEDGASFWECLLWLLILLLMVKESWLSIRTSLFVKLLLLLYMTSSLSDDDDVSISNDMFSVLLARDVS